MTSTPTRSGALARRNPGATSSTSLSARSASIFYESFLAKGSSADGSLSALADYKVLPPTNCKAYFHFLLDASASTWDRCSTGESHQRVFEALLDSFTDLILRHPDVVRPSDEIVVWTFNKRTQHLCSVRQKDFHTRVSFIRDRYHRELNDKANSGETRLYDAVGVAMDKIKETWMANKKADFFLVPFTDGMDNTSVMSLAGMWTKITEISARLHTFFITANLPEGCPLSKRLASQSGEMELIELENTEPSEIRRGFERLRELIKAILVLVTQNRGDIQVTRIAGYGKTKRDVAETMMRALEVRMRDSSLMEAVNSLRL